MKSGGDLEASPNSGDMTPMRPLRRNATVKISRLITYDSFPLVVIVLRQLPAICFVI